jgi:hypothetical protein
MLEFARELGKIEGNDIPDGVQVDVEVRDCHKIIRPKYF